MTLIWLLVLDLYMFVILTQIFPNLKAVPDPENN